MHLEDPSCINLHVEALAPGKLDPPPATAEQVVERHRQHGLDVAAGHRDADASAPALSSFQRIYWIAGGLAKEGGIEPLRGFFPRIARAYLIGEAAPAFSATLGEAVPYEISGTLAAAVEHAARDAAKDEGGEAVVLLSPACASFDQFKNFEVRGESFRQAVAAIEGVQPI